MTSALLETPSFEPVADTSVAVRRVLHVINGEHYSGAERVQDLLALCLPEEGFEVGFACVKPRQFPKLRQSQASTLVEVPMRSRVDLRAVRRLVRIIREGDYTLVHAHTPRTAIVGRMAARMAGVPFVYHVHSPTVRDSTHPWRNRCNALAERLAIAGAARLIAVSESLGRHLAKQGIARQRITVIPNGVPLVVNPEPRMAPHGVWTLGAVALFRPRKGVEVLLDALAILREQGVNVRLRAIGGFETVEYEREVRAHAERLNLVEHIEWTGFVRDVTRELDTLDVLVLPSLFGEGLPMVVLEAMAAGVPVAATRVEGVPEAIRDGVDGVLAEPGNAQDLAAAIRRIVDGELDWQQMRHNARQRHAERFSDEAMAAQLATVYREILDK